MLHFAAAVAEFLGLNAHTISLSADGNRLYAGGSFSNIGGLRRRYLAALDVGSGAAVSGFDARAASTVHAVATSGTNSQIFAGGEFTSVNGVPRINVAALDANGVLDPNFVADTDTRDTNPNVEVDALAIDGGQLYLGGNFLRVNGVSEVRLARVDAATGAVDKSFHASPSAAINAAW